MVNVPVCEAAAEPENEAAGSAPALAGPGLPSLMSLRCNCDAAEGDAKDAPTAFAVAAAVSPVSLAAVGRVTAGPRPLPAVTAAASAGIEGAKTLLPAAAVKAALVAGAGASSDIASSSDKSTAPRLRPPLPRLCLRVAVRPALRPGSAPDRAAASGSTIDSAAAAAAAAVAASTAVSPSESLALSTQIVVSREVDVPPSSEVNVAFAALLVKEAPAAEGAPALVAAAIPAPAAAAGVPPAVALLVVAAAAALVPSESQKRSTTTALSVTPSNRCFNIGAERSTTTVLPVALSVTPSGRA